MWLAPALTLSLSAVQGFAGVGSSNDLDPQTFSAQI